MFTLTFSGVNVFTRRHFHKFSGMEIPFMWCVDSTITQQHPARLFVKLSSKIANEIFLYVCGQALYHGRLRSIRLISQ